MTNPIIPKLCACGCGRTFTPTRKRPHSRFVFGHRLGLRPAVSEAPLCACGCGERTLKVGRRRLFNKYVGGHHLRVVNAPRPPEACTNWRGGVTYRNGYVYIHTPDHHRAIDQRTKRCYLVMEATLGRPLTKVEEVHHINGVKDDDRPENLTVMTKAEHMRHHMLERQN